MIKTMSFKGRITGLVVVAMVTVAMLAVAAVWLIAGKITESRRNELVAVVDTAHSQVLSFYAKAKSGQMDTAQAQAAAIAALRGARYGQGPDGHPNSPTHGHLKFPHPERASMRR